MKIETKKCNAVLKILAVQLLPQNPKLLPRQFAFKCWNVPIVEWRRQLWQTVLTFNLFNLLVSIFMLLLIF